MYSGIQSLQRVTLIFVYLSIFTQASIEKMSQRGVPSWFRAQFETTVLNLFPGALGLLFSGIVVLEALTAFVFLLAFFRPGFLGKGLLLAQVTFLALGFGLRIAGDFNGAFQLFGYFALTYLMSRSIDFVSSAA